MRICCSSLSFSIHRCLASCPSAGTAFFLARIPFYGSLQPLALRKSGYCNAAAALKDTTKYFSHEVEKPRDASLKPILEQVRNIPVSCSPLPLLALEFHPPRTKVLKSVESSLRVDAIASAGFQMSRSKLVNLISSGDVRVNWTNVTKNGMTINTGDIISIRGQGRVQLGEVKTTRKGKFAVELIRYS